uniref:OBP47-like domain-containing protein n=1 Tax=Anopheles farauti TaxID=69004 RepID=A0A182Q6A7_9DIPT
MYQHNFPEDPFRACYEKLKTPAMTNDTLMCYYEAIGMISNGKRVEADKYYAYRDTLQPSMREVFTHALKFCAKITAKAIAQLTARGQTFKCHPVAYFFNRCLSEVCLTNCPPERWMNSIRTEPSHHSSSTRHPTQTHPVFAMVQRQQRTASLIGPGSLLKLLTLWRLWSCCSALPFNFESEQLINCNKPPLEAHPKDCCQLPSLIDDDLLRTCKNLYGGEQLQRTLIYERGKCFVECALNATGTMVNGVLDQTKILNIITTATQNDPAVMQLFQGNTLQCLQIISGTVDDQQPAKGCKLSDTPLEQ